MKTIRSLVFTFLAALLFASPARAVDAVVNTLSDELDTPSGANISLREAIRDVGNSGGTITFDPSLDGGVIEVSNNQFADAALIAANTTVNVVIDALALPSGLTIDGGNRHYFFQPALSSVTLRGLTFRNGTVGGGISNGPIEVVGTALTIEHCTFANNSGRNVTSGGGCISARDSQVKIVGCTFFKNTVGTVSTAAGGGALHVRGSSTVEVFNSTFTGNDGGVCMDKKKANAGGAILLQGVTGGITLSHCTITQNLATEGGGGLAVVDSPNAVVIVENSIIANNEGGVAAAGFAVNATGRGNDVLMASSLPGAVAPKVTIRGACIIPGLRSERTDGATAGNGLVLTVNPNLFVLGNFGGRTQTITLRPGSPAIDAAPDPMSGLTDDQCGNPRKRGPRCDIGAVEFSPFAFNGLGVEVTTAADELDPFGVLGAGISLREALRDAPNGARITFSEKLDDFGPPVITLNPALGPLRPRAGVTYLIEGNNLAPSATSAGVSIDGGGQTQVMQVDAGVTVLLSRLTIKGGNGQQSNVGNFVGGGGIVNGGNLTLVECSVEGHTSKTRGGGIENNGTLFAQRSTFESNTANTIPDPLGSGGGAVCNLGKATFANCTFTGNNAQYGGAIDQTFISGAPLPELTLNHCTVTGNAATEIAGAGGIYSFFDWTLADSIVAGNTPNDVTNDNTETFQEKGLSALYKNIVQAFTNTSAGRIFHVEQPEGALANGKFATILVTDPKLGSVGQLGGSTRTVPLLAGSPAIDAAGRSLSSSAGPTDQRGFGIVDGKADIGAYEAGAFGAGSFKVQVRDNTSPALPERAAPAGAPIVITSGDSELTLDVSGDGSFKGTLVFLGGKYTFSGQLREDRTASIQLTGRNLPPLTLDLTISGVNDETIEVNVTGATFAGRGAGTELVPAKKYTAPPEVVGRYTGVIVDGLAVVGVLAFEITKTGAVRLIGSLDDGTKFAAGTRLSGDSVNNAVFNCRIPLYQKKGFMALEIAPAQDGLATIHRPPGAKPATPASLAGGFERSGLQIVPRRYLPPAKGAPLIPGVSDNPMGMHADLKTGDGSASRLTAYDFTLPSTGKATSAVTGFRLKATPKLGIFVGTHPNPTVGANPPVLPFVGVLMQNNAFSAGYGLSKDANVPYWLELQGGPQ